MSVGYGHSVYGTGTYGQLSVYFTYAGTSTSTFAGMSTFTYDGDTE